MLSINELFAGIGAIRQALIALDFPHEIVGISEIDKYSVASYEGMYGPTRNYGDISKVDKLDYADMWVYGFPCQDISVAGLGKGIVEGETRSGLLYEVKRLLQVARDHDELPKYLILENVKNLVSKKHIGKFNEWLEYLEELGYVTHWKVLNAKDYGIPQNRERVFAVSIRKNCNTEFVFPEPIVLKYRLKDILEKEVDEKYYLSNKGVDFVLDQYRQEHQITKINGDVALCITAKGNANWTGNFIGETSVEQIGNIFPTAKRDNPNQGRVYDPKGLSPSLTTMGGGNREPFIVASRGRNPDNPSDRRGGIYLEQRLEPNRQGIANTISTIQKDNYVVIPEATKKGYAEAYEGDGIYINRPHQKRGVVQHQKIQTLSTCPQNDLGVVVDNLRIRKLTPLECWRLMGFPDESFLKAKVALNNKFYKGKDRSNSQLYKQAGNSIFTGCLIAILYSLRYGKTEGWDKYLTWKGEN